MCNEKHSFLREVFENNGDKQLRPSDNVCIGDDFWMSQNLIFVLGREDSEDHGPQDQWSGQQFSAVRLQAPDQSVQMLIEVTNGRAFGPFLKSAHASQLNGLRSAVVL